MVGETNVSGAGNLRAVIAVTYPEGSVCTCSNGTKTLRARNTSGKALFNVTVGEWTVSATDGSQTTSNTVSITAEGQIINVELKYIPWLYKDGDECVNVTGGWVESYQPGLGGGTFKKENTYLFYDTGATQTADGVTKNKINVTNFDELVVEVTDAFFTPNLQFSYWAIQLTASIDPIASEVATTTTTGNSATLDISSISGDYYVNVSAGNGCQFKVTKVYLR